MSTNLSTNNVLSPSYTLIICKPYYIYLLTGFVALMAYCVPLIIIVASAAWSCILLSCVCIAINPLLQGIFFNSIHLTANLLCFPQGWMKYVLFSCIYIHTLL